MPFDLIQEWGFKRPPLQELGKAMKADAYLFPVRPAIRWAGGSGSFRSNERDWIAPNPPAGAYLDLYAKAPSDGATVAITDKAGKPVRTLRGIRLAAGVTRIVWDLRYDGQGGGGRGGRGGAAAQVPAGMEDVPPEALARFGFGGGGPAVLPGDYTVKVKVGAQELSGTVHVGLDPKVQATDADLQAQLEAVQTMGAMTARVNGIIDRVNDVVAQLTALDAVLAKQAPVPASAGDVKKTMETLKAFRDDELMRPPPAMGYRQYPRLREDVQSISGGLGRGFRAPNEGERIRMKELADLTDKAAAKLNGILAGDIATINDAMKGQPRIAADLVK